MTGDLIDKVSLYLNEEELTTILIHLPDEDTKLRRYLQRAGINKFDWNL